MLNVKKTITIYDDDNNDRYIVERTNGTIDLIAGFDGHAAEDGSWEDTFGGSQNLIDEFAKYGDISDEDDQLDDWENDAKEAGEDTEDYFFDRIRRALTDELTPSECKNLKITDLD